MPTATAHIEGFAGTVLTPGDERYDAARAVFNGAIDRRPALVAEVADAHDVAAAIAHGRGLDLPIAVRAGGHSGAGYGVVDDGLVIDVRAMRRVEADLAARTVRAGAGLTWAELDAATQAHGLAVTGGRVSHTGVAGLTLGSGSGWLERLHGLTADNLVGATVVTANGELGGCAALQLAPPAPFVSRRLVGEPVLSIVVAAFGDLARAERLVAP